MQGLQGLPEVCREYFCGFVGAPACRHVLGKALKNKKLASQSTSNLASFMYCKLISTIVILVINISYPCHLVLTIISICVLHA